MGVVLDTSVLIAAERGTFALHALLAWIAVDALGRWRFGAVPGVLYAMGGAVLTMTAVLTIHARGFERPRLARIGRAVDGLLHSASGTGAGGMAMSSGSIWSACGATALWPKKSPNSKVPIG